MKMQTFQCDRCGKQSIEPEGEDHHKITGLFNGSSNNPTMNPLTGFNYPTETTEAVELCICCYEALKAYYLGKKISPWAQGAIENENEYMGQMRHEYKKRKDESDKARIDR